MGTIRWVKPTHLHTLTAFRKRLNCHVSWHDRQLNHTVVAKQWPSRIWWVQVGASGSNHQHGGTYRLSLTRMSVCVCGCDGQAVLIVCESWELLPQLGAVVVVVGACVGVGGRQFMVGTNVIVGVIYSVSSVFRERGLGIVSLGDKCSCVVLGYFLEGLAGKF